MKTPLPAAAHPIRLYLGTMTFNWTSQTSAPVTQSIANDMLTSFLSHSIPNDDDDSDVVSNTYNKKYFIDTARIYANGTTEQMLGEALHALQQTTSSKNDNERALFCIGTKAHPSQPGGLSKEGILQQLSTSLTTMKLTVNETNQNKSPAPVIVDEYYLHQPDTEHSLLESLTCLHDLVQQGTIQSIGMSNYAACEMNRAFELCEEYNLTKPSVYQGLYNPLNRLVEDELLDVLRRHGCSFVAYNPLAAGLLTGKYRTGTATGSSPNESNVPQGRFRNNPNYLPRFYTEANFKAVDVIYKACEAEGISMVDATYLWLLNHSKLDGRYNDGLLIGASSLSQLESNLNACSNARTRVLSDTILKSFDEAWDIVSNGEERIFPYWRSFSADMPNREELDHGASYNANKVASK